MYFYQATLRLNGFTMNEVRKTVTAPEFLILQYIHGKDALHQVKETKNEKVNPAQERRRLKSVYDKALKRKKQSVDLIFGPLGSLPTRLPEETLDRFNIDSTQEIPEIGRIDAGKGNTYNRNEPVTEKELQNLENIVSADEVSVADLMD